MMIVPGGAGLLGPVGAPSPGPEVSAFRWATVVSTDPLTLRLDGDTEPLPLEPDDLTEHRLDPGHRVWCQLFGRRVIVLGASGRIAGLLLPASYSVEWGSSSGTVTSGTYADLTDMGSALIDLPAAAVVRIDMSAWATIGSENAAACTVRFGAGVDGGLANADGSQHCAYLAQVGSTAQTNASQLSVTRWVTLDAGMHEITMQAMKTGTRSTTLGFRYLHVGVEMWV